MFASLALLPFAMLAQNPRGSLLVTVQDSSGGRIAGANVSLKQEKFAITRTAKADAQGEARFESLQPGPYTVTVDASGFAGKTATVVVAVSSQPTLVVTLKPKSVQESVEVSDRGPSLASQPLETTSSTIKTVITSADLDEVPLADSAFDPENIAHDAVSEVKPRPCVSAMVASNHWNSTQADHSRERTPATLLPQCPAPLPRKTARVDSSASIRFHWVAWP